MSVGDFQVERIEVLVLSPACDITLACAIAAILETLDQACATKTTYDGKFEDQETADYPSQSYETTGVVFLLGAENK